MFRASTLSLHLVLILTAGTASGAAAQPLAIYHDAMAAGWENWSWATHDLQNTDPVHSGAFSISFEPDAWEGLFFHSTVGRSLAEHDRLRFQVHGGASGGQELGLVLRLGDSELGSGSLSTWLPGGSLPGGSWTEVVVPLADFGAVDAFDGILLMAWTAADQATVSVDDVDLLENETEPPPPTPVAIAVDPAADRRPIDPRIYGVNFGDPDQVAALRYPLRRRGGNSTTRYNWRIDVHNTAADYFFQNIAAPDPGTLPHGSAADVFVDETLAAGGDVILTAPTIGWTPLETDRDKRWGFSVADYGAQTQVECDLYDPPPFWCSEDSGNGECDASNQTAFCVDGRIVGNDPADTSIAITPDFVGDWVDHVVARVGTAAEGGVRFWALDNEPMLWDSTHRDVSPQPLDYDGLWTRIVDVATEIATRDPSAEILGPVSWGWCAFFTSAADAAVGPSCVDGPDRQAHGGLALVPWVLQQNCAHETATGLRPIDALDVHYYPQGGVDGLGPASSGEDAVTSARRLRSLRELWDPSWVAESWIAEPVMLIPRMRSWIDTHCPGVGLALTEYRWGPDDGPSGALAQAEALAIFGREGVDLATRWVAPEPGTRTEDAFRLYLDFDGEGGRLVGTSVSAVSADADAVGAFAIERGDGSLAILLFNKEVAVRTAEVAVGGTLGSAAGWRFDATTPLGPLGPIATSAGGFDLDLPPRSATLVVASTGLFADGFESGDTSVWQ